MSDFILQGLVVILPTVFALGVETFSKKVRETIYYRIGVAVFGISLSTLTWFAMSRASRNAEIDREAAIKETSQQVAAKTSASVTKAVSEQYSQMISDQKRQIEALQNQLTAQGKDVNTIKSSNIVTGKNPIKVQVTNPTASPQPAPLFSGIRIASQKQIPSDDQGFPFGIEIVLQTDVDISPVRVAVLCDGSIGKGTATEGGGMYTMMITGVADGNDKAFVIKWDSPPWTPQNPITVRLFSKDAIHATGLSRNVH